MSSINWMTIAEEAVRAFGDGSVLDQDQRTLERWLVALSFAIHRSTSNPEILQGQRDAIERLLAARSTEPMRRYELLAQHSRDIVLFMRSRDGHLLEVNAAAVAAYGYTREELLALTIHNLRAPATQNTVAAQMGAANERGILFETAHRRKNGSIFPVEVSSQGAEIAGERTLISIVRDITARKQADEALRLSEEKFAKAFASNPAALVFTRLEDGHILEVNETWCHMFGYSRAEAIGQSSLALNVWPSPAERTRWIAEVARRRSFRDWEQTLQKRSGESLVTVGSAEILRLGGEEIILSTWLDITRRKMAEEEMRLASQRFETALAASPVMVFNQDRNLRYTWVHNAPPGMEPNALLGKCDAEIFPRREDAESLDAIKREVLASGRGQRREIVLWLDGVERDCDLTIQPQHDAAGAVVGITCAAVDITDRKRAEAELNDARRAAEAASNAKDHFLAVLSHELRTPLTPVLATAELLEADRSLSPEHHDMIQMMRRNVELEARLIDDLLDLTRIARNKLELHLAPVDVHEKIGDVLRICEEEILAKQLSIVLQLSAKAHHIEADPTRFQQIVWNVLKNAVKFTPASGRITVSTTNTAGNRLTIEITDTGVGIAPELLPRIFAAFEQGGREVTRQFGGLGLGLAISRALVEMHGGSIDAQSEGAGRGSTFTISLPVRAQPGASNASLPSAKSAKLAGSILLVEDHADTLRAMTWLLTRVGCDVTPASTVAEALRLANERHFDLLVSDIGLPDGTGLELMQALKTRFNIAGIALTGFGMDEDVARTKEAGFAVHLRKPVNIRLLEQAVRQLLGS